MKDMKLKLTFVLMSIVTFFVLMGLAGNIDYTDHVILHMNYDDYKDIKQRLMEENDGKVPSDSEIVRWWEKHHE